MAKAAAGTPKARGKADTRTSTRKAEPAKKAQKKAAIPRASGRGKASAAPAKKAVAAPTKRAVTKAPARPAKGTASKKAVSKRAVPSAKAPAKGSSAKAPAKAPAKATTIPAAGKAAKGGSTAKAASSPAGQDGKDGKEGAVADPAATAGGAPKVATGQLRRRVALRSASIPLPEPPKKPPTPLPAVTLAKLRRLLEEERATYLRQADELAAEAEALTAEREPGDTQFDEESGEGDTIAVERERDLALSASARQAVEEIDRAIARMDGGTFGYCTSCGNKIPMARLEALPYAALCIPCKSREERRR